LRAEKRGARAQALDSLLESPVANKKPEPAQPNSNDQSGSTGRPTEKKDLGKDKDAGQDRYGQTNLGGNQHRETQGQKDYKESGGQPGSKTDSNRGSGNAADESEKGKTKPTTHRP
jgi:hypothetical protein